MRLPSGRLCTLACAFWLVNLVVFITIAPSQWRLGRSLKRRQKKTNLYTLRDNITSELTTVQDDTFNQTTVATPEKIRVEGRIGKARQDCPENSNLLIGQIGVNFEQSENNYWLESNIETPKSNESTYLGEYTVYNESRFNSSNVYTESELCRPVYTVAIIIPFRDRESHLRRLLGHLVPILRKQLVRYSIFVVEQLGDDTFNKGRLMNTGFEYVSGLGREMGSPYDCYIFQDVDLLPENDNILYRCHSGIHHLSTAIDKFGYRRLCCGMTVGGVVGLTEEKYRKVNGFSNSYWGWGAEDDDLNKRIKFMNFKIVRPMGRIGRFTMIKHDRDKKNPSNTGRLGMLQAAKNRYETDGLSTLDTRIDSYHLYPLFMKIIVDVGSQPIASNSTSTE